MKHILTKINYYISLFIIVTLLLAGCKDDTTESYEISINPTDIVLNGGGDTQKLDVVSNGSWQIEVSQDDKDWLEVSPSHGEGAQIITLKSKANFNAGKQVSITLKTPYATKQVSLKVGEVKFMGENFDAKFAPINFPYPKIAYFTGWQQAGPGSHTSIFTGDNSYVCNNYNSTGYANASGTNNIMLDGANSTFSIENIDLSIKDDVTYTLLFGCAKIGEEGYEEFTQDDMNAYISFNGLDYLPIQYTLSDDNNWRQASVTFNIYNASKLNLKFESRTANIRIDDVSIAEGGETTVDPTFFVKTVAASEITKNSATMNARWLYTGTSPIAEAGFEYNIDDESEVVTVKSNSLAAELSVPISNLNQGESYVYRAYVKGSDGEITYGEFNQFITLIEPIDMKISDVRGICNGAASKLPAAWVLTARVVSDIAGKNIGSSSIAVVDDNKPGSGLIVNLINSDGTPAPHNYAVNDKVVIALRGARFTAGTTPIQINVMSNQVEATTMSDVVEPIEVTSVSDLAQYESMLVRINDTEAAAMYTTRPWGWAVTESASTITVVMEHKNENYSVSTLADATYGSVIVGQNSGSINGVLLYIGDELHLMPRSTNDIALTNTRFGTLNEQIVYYEDFGKDPVSKAILFSDFDGYTAQGQIPNNVTFEDNKSPTNGKVAVTNVTSDGGYDGASGQNNCYINQNSVKLYIKGINTTDQNYMYMTFGVSFMNTGKTLKSSPTANCVIRCSTDQGKTWSPVPYNIIQEGNGTSLWALAEIDRSFVIPATEDLWFEIFFKINNSHIDDIKIVTYKK